VKLVEKWPACGMMPTGSDEPVETGDGSGEWEGG
jgi:hypothetical protein